MDGKWEFKIATNQVDELIIIDNVEIPLIYPKMKESILFWEMVDAFTKSTDETSQINLDKLTEEEKQNYINDHKDIIYKMGTDIIPKVYSYLEWCIQTKQGFEMNKEQKESFYVFVTIHINNLSLELMNFISKIIPNDQKKIGAKQTASQIE